MKDIKQGDFFVELDECVACGCCEEVAPKLFSSAEDSYVSFVKAQPETDDDLKLMFQAIEICMMDCIYYRGQNSVLKESVLKASSHPTPSLVTLVREKLAFVLRVLFRVSSKHRETKHRFDD